MTLFPKPLEIGDEEGFIEKDIFNRKAFGEGMTRLVSEVEDPMIIAFDGQWGSGKTTFLKMWAGELRKADFPVIFLDAFETDYVGDPFAVLAREIVALAKRHEAEVGGISSEVKDKAAKLGKTLLRTSVRIAANMAVRAASAGMAQVSDFEGLSEAFSDAANDEANKYIDELLSGSEAEAKTVKDFRDVLSELPSRIVGGENPKPLIFIVDELDRCKPSYALHMIERMKHFFQVPNVHFVLGVKLAQLESSVRHAYGADVDATDYLQKFIGLRLLNPTNLPDQRMCVDVYADLLVKEISSTAGRESDRARLARLAADVIAHVVKRKGKGLRTIERAFAALKISIFFVDERMFKQGSVLGALIMMKILDPNSYSKAKNGSISYSDFCKFLEVSERKGDDRALGIDFLFALLDPGGGEYWETYCQDLIAFGLWDREEVIPHLANNVIDNFSS